MVMSYDSKNSLRPRSRVAAWSGWSRHAAIASEVSTAQSPVAQSDTMDTMPLAAAPETLFRRLYEELLEPAFPPTELMTYDELKDAVESGEATGVVLAEDDTPLGGAV